MVNNDKDIVLTKAIKKRIHECVARREIYKAFCSGYAAGHITRDILKEIEEWSDELGNVDTLLDISEVKEYVDSYLENLNNWLAKRVNKVDMYIYHFPINAIEDLISSTHSFNIDTFK